MRCVRAALISAAFTTLITDGAFAVGVSPDPDSPAVLLENQDEIKPRAGSGTAQIADPPAQPVTCQWFGYRRECAGVSIEVFLPNDPVVVAEIRRAVESVGLPALALRIQPGGQTLVNVETIFHTEAPEFRHSTVLLGQAVEITATPAKFTWHHGDGTTQTTSTPGAPYPSTEVTHRYTHVATGLTPRVDVGYRVSYRVNGGAVQEIDQLITASGPPAGLDVAEAAPVVVAP